MRRHMMTALFAGALVSLAGSGAVQAEDNVQFDYRATGGTLPGRLQDGAVLGKGRLIFHGPHRGFRVWSDQLASGSVQGHYVLEGRQTREHHLHVRVESKSGAPDPSGGKGVVMPTGEDTAFIYVVVDGEQQVPADGYPVFLQAAILPP